MPRKSRAEILREAQEREQQQQQGGEEGEPTGDDLTMEGFPEHGSEYNADEGGEQGDEGEPRQEELPLDDPNKDQQGSVSKEAYDQLAARLEETQRQLRRLEKQIPPQNAGQQQEAPKKDPFDDVDFEKLIFQDPQKALKMHAEMVRDQVKQEMTQMYQREQGTQKFWNDFYQANPDLKDDHDLVEMTLNANLNDLIDEPVPQAIEKLADLTRQKILRYSGKGQNKDDGKSPKRQKAQAEGASRPAPKQPPQEEPGPSTLSDLIRARNKRRTEKATAA